MLCYRDRTFCPFYKDCIKGSDCRVALTDKIKEDASEWWKSFKSKDPVPISVYLDKPHCFEGGK